jgi:carboxymethylenebutenolidase
VTARTIEITTADGVAQARVFRPAAADVDQRLPGVVLYMDAFGLRPALDGMAERLAGMGYVVLVPDLLYRFAPYGPYDAKTAFETSRDEIMGMIKGTTLAMTVRDTEFFLEALSREGARGPFGTVGYCMGGGRAIMAAAAYPDQVAAAASFHGGNLASDAEDSPHRSAGSIRGRVYVGSAGTDRSFPPEQSAKLAQALREAGVDHTIENYVGMEHGWAVPDHGVFNETGAERHWKRLETFFGETLG